MERSELLAEEAALLASLDAAAGKEGATSEAGTTAAAERLQVVSSRLQEIGAEQAVAKAASILAGLSFDPAMQQRATKTFSGGPPPPSPSLCQASCCAHSPCMYRACRVKTSRQVYWFLGSAGSLGVCRGVDVAISYVHRLRSCVIAGGR